VFPSDLSDRLLALYDQPRRLFTKLRGILPILLGHSDRSLPERNLLVPLRKVGGTPRSATLCWIWAIAPRSSGFWSATGPGSSPHRFDAVLRQCRRYRGEDSTRSPRANAYVERFMLRARTEVTDRMLTFGDRHRVLS
jgi:hypothetical protein